MTTASPSAAAMRSIERIKACLNGGRRRDEHPAVPVTPAELAAAAAAAVRAEAEAVHLHARSGNGAESLRALDIAAAEGPVRHACPDVPAGLWEALARQVSEHEFALVREDPRPPAPSAR